MTRPCRPDHAAAGAGNGCDVATPTRDDHTPDGADDADITGAAAEIAAHRHANFLLVRSRAAQNKVARRDQHSRRAVAALQGVLALESLAQFARDLVVVQSLDGDDFGAVAGDRIGDAGAHRYAVDQDRAGAADAVLAAEMGAGQVAAFAQEIGQMRARPDRSGNRLAVDGERNLVHAPAACRTARASATVWICLSRGPLMPADCSEASTALRSNAARSHLPPNQGRASASTSGLRSVAPMTARNTLRVRSSSTAPIAWAYSPVLRQVL